MQTETGSAGVWQGDDRARSPCRRSAQFSWHRRGCLRFFVRGFAFGCELDSRVKRDTTERHAPSPDESSTPGDPRDPALQIRGIRAFKSRECFLLRFPRCSSGDGRRRPGLTVGARDRGNRRGTCARGGLARGPTVGRGIRRPGEPRIGEDELESMTWRGSENSTSASPRNSSSPPSSATQVTAIGNRPWPSVRLR